MKPLDNTTALGRYGERVAARFFVKEGYRILEQNYHASHNEIDLIAENRDYIVFIEVKARSRSSLDTAYGTPASAVTRSKQLRLVQAAYAYLSDHPTQKQPRMDVFEIYFEKRHSPLKRPRVLEYNHIIDAFGG